MQLMIAAEFRVITAAEIFFQPYVKADKKISASHFLDFQLGSSSPPVAPGDRDSGPRVSTDDRFKRQLDCEIEMRRNQRTAAIDYEFAVGFEGVRGVVQSNMEKYL